MKSSNRCAHSPDSHGQNYRNQTVVVPLDEILVIQFDFMRTQGMVSMYAKVKYIIMSLGGSPTYAAIKKYASDNCNVFLVFCNFPHLDSVVV